MISKQLSLQDLLHITSFNNKTKYHPDGIKTICPHQRQFHGGISFRHQSSV